MFDNVNRYFSIRPEDRNVILGTGIGEIVEEPKPVEPDIIEATEEIEEIGDYNFEEGATIDDLIEADESVEIPLEDGDSDADADLEIDVDSMFAEEDSDESDGTEVDDEIKEI